MAGDGRSEALRVFFARGVAAQGRVRDLRIEQAFASVERERFAGPGPWCIYIIGSGYVRTPTDDPAFLYQDTLVALDAARGINIGHPSAHAAWLDALALKEGESVIQVGAGTGYYTTLLAYLVGPRGRVHAYEIDPGLAAWAAENVACLPWVTVHGQSGVAGALPEADAVYVNAGVSQPSPVWLDAVRAGGRRLFPLHGEGEYGGMLMIRKLAHGSAWPADFVTKAAFIPCVGGQHPETGLRLHAAFRAGGSEAVRCFRLDDAMDDTCWFAGDEWWLSTWEAEAAVG